MSREGQIIYIIALDHAIRDRLHAVVIYSHRAQGMEGDLSTTF